MSGRQFVNLSKLKDISISFFRILQSLIRKDPLEGFEPDLPLESKDSLNNMKCLTGRIEVYVKDIEESEVPPNMAWIHENLNTLLDDAADYEEKQNAKIIL